MKFNRKNKIKLEIYFIYQYFLTFFFLFRKQMMKIQEMMNQQNFIIIMKEELVNSNKILLKMQFQMY